MRKGEETDWSDASTVATGHNSTVYSVMGLHPFSVYSFKERVNILPQIYFSNLTKIYFWDFLPTKLVD